MLKREHLAALVECAEAMADGAPNPAPLEDAARAGREELAHDAFDAAMDMLREAETTTLTDDVVPLVAKARWELERVMERADEATLELFHLAGGECEHGTGFANECREGAECPFAVVRPALRAAWHRRMRAREVLAAAE